MMFFGLSLLALLGGSGSAFSSLFPRFLASFRTELLLLCFVRDFFGEPVSLAFPSADWSSEAGLYPSAWLLPSSSPSDDAFFLLLVPSSSMFALALVRSIPRPDGGLAGRLDRAAGLLSLTLSLSSLCPLSLFLFSDRRTLDHRAFTGYSLTSFTAAGREGESDTGNRESYRFSFNFSFKFNFFN
jgi:hypothetical protein